MQDRVKNTVKAATYHHRGDQSSWSVRKLLSNLRTLNILLYEGAVKDTLKLLSTFKKNSSRPSTETSKLLKKINQISLEHIKATREAPETIREMFILKRYVSKKQKQNKLPSNISKEYKLKLLLPLALHELSLIKFNRIASKIRKVPTTSITSTMAGRSRVWFVRSAVNKGKRQSKMLGSLIRYERKMNQKIIDGIHKCEMDADWALHEAIWENYLESNVILNYDTGKYLNAIRKNQNVNSHIHDWLSPLQKVVGDLNMRSLEKSKTFIDFKEKTLINGGLARYFEKRAMTMHSKRLERFQKMVKTDLPHVIPFVTNQTLSACLAKYHF